MVWWWIGLGCGAPAPASRAPEPEPTGRSWPQFAAFEPDSDGCRWLVREPDGSSRHLVTLPACADGWGIASNRDAGLAVLGDGRLVLARFVNRSYDVLPE